MKSNSSTARCQSTRPAGKFVVRGDEKNLYGRQNQTFPDIHQHFRPPLFTCHLLYPLAQRPHPREAQPFGTFCTLESDYEITDIQTRAIELTIQESP